eukprot:m.104607 g.104607  ORF g.104607 m.104607 type:complete len:52 (-) comp9112_c1_seq3:2187-2342(-)
MKVTQIYIMKASHMYLNQPKTTFRNAMVGCNYQVFDQMMLVWLNNGGCFFQ